MADATLPLLVHWEKTLHDLFGRIRKFPKSVRFTFSNRIDNLALDIYEALIEAKYTRPDGPAPAAAINQRWRRFSSTRSAS